MAGVCFLPRRLVLNAQPTFRHRRQISNQRLQMAAVNGVQKADEQVVGIHPDLAGKRVLITGGSAGIGRAAALAFDANGAVVTVMARRKERLAAVVALLKQGHMVVGDLSQPDDCARIVEEAIAAMDGIDILVNSGASVTEEMVTAAGTVRALEAAFQFHVTSTFALIKAAEPELLANRGAIVNVSSIASVSSNYSPGSMAYGIAKAAQNKMMQSLALQYAPHGVRINSVLPAWTDTEAVPKFAAFLKMPVDEFKSAAGRLHPLQRISDPAEQAAAIVFLASKAAGFVTGHRLLVDGGITLLVKSQPSGADDT